MDPPTFPVSPRLEFLHEDPHLSSRLPWIGSLDERSSSRGLENCINGKTR